MLTYQSLAVFDPDNEVGDDPQDEPSLIDALHVNGRRLLESLQQTEGLLLVLDECHHLLEVWGRLLAEILGSMPHARVLGLTATPPDALSREQADLVAHLFGEVAFSTSIPAVVKEGDLVPFAELAWLVEPTPEEQDWLDEQAVRFTELTTALTRPGFADVAFLDWLRTRFVDPVPDTLAWSEIVAREPDLADAALRMHHAGLLDLPTGARLTEQHRVPPTVEDWMALVEEWALGLDDPDVTDALRRALPVGRLRVDPRRRPARTHAHRPRAGALGGQGRRHGRHRHRRARGPGGAACACWCSATTSAPEPPCRPRWSGCSTSRPARPARSSPRCSATRAPGRCARSWSPAARSPVAHATLAALREQVRLTDPGHRGHAADRAAGQPRDRGPRPPGTCARPARRRRATPAPAPVGDEAAAYRLEGRWSSRQWVAHVTRLLTGGGTQVLVGTRGLLGEGWDARCITGLVDLTTATSLTAVVQTRGRALRTDPAWPDKVAVTWSVTCVSDRHPRGSNDWQRLVRKHTGFHGVDEDGTVADGVAHLDAAFSPYAPPPVAEFPAVNARMMVRAEDRDAIAAAWRVGEPYVDRTSVALRLRPRRPRPALHRRRSPRAAGEPSTGLTGTTPERPAAAPGGRVAPGPRAGGSAGGRRASWLGVVGLTHLAAGRGRWRSCWPSPWCRWRSGGVPPGSPRATAVRRRVEEAGRPPSLAQVARALADGLHGADLVARGAEAVEVETTRSGEHRLLLGGVEEAESELFATALEELVSPLAAPRYVISRYVTDPVERPGAGAADRRAARPSRRAADPADGRGVARGPEVAGGQRRARRGAARRAGGAGWARGGRCAPRRPRAPGCCGRRSAATRSRSVP